jgi:sialate O-acetylesterase
MRNIFSLFNILLFVIMATNTLSAEVRLPSIVGDGMVLQRNENIKVWGWANAGEQVAVDFMNRSYETEAGADGKWQVVLETAKAGGPYTMEISGENSIVLDNILIGDVWIFSGQSNMTHYFGRHQERYSKEIAAADEPEIRQIFVPTNPVLTGPAKDVENIEWVAATPETVLDFTVIGYFFCKKLYDEYDIPMGIINTCVGGTPIEAWTSEEGFKEFSGILETIEQNKDTDYVNRVNREASESRMEGAPKGVQDKGLKGDVKWFSPDYEPLNWKRINIPGYWEDQGVNNLDGVVWYRRVFDVPKQMTGVEALVKLGRIRNADELYINGKRVGNTTYEYPQREYTIPAGVLKPGKNLFVVRVTNQYGKGGFIPNKPYLLLAAGDTIDIKGYWQYKVGEVYRHDKQFKHGISAQNSPTALYNGMIAPFTNYAVRGFVWYQGESNAGNPEAYKDFQPNLINDWRNKWDMEKLPFLIAQLPNYMDVDYLPAESNWAKIRDVQLQTALDMENVGIGINIDLGEWNDIHPGNKKPVGERLALVAQQISYGEDDIVSSGPIYRSYKLDGNRIILSFDHVGSGLISGNGEELAHFALSSEDGKFYWANARIEGDKVVVWHEDIESPVELRYAWADNPDFANLYNKEGLPASPFKVEIEK